MPVAFAILNFIIASISLAANAVSNVNSNSNNNNNNNNDNNNNDNNVNIANNNNNANNMNTVMFLPAIGKRRRRRDLLLAKNPSLSRTVIRALESFLALETCDSRDCRRQIMCRARYLSQDKEYAILSNHILDGILDSYGSTDSD